MGFAGGRLVAVIVLCFSINALLCLGRKKPSKDRLYECIQKQLCKCNMNERFKGCYEHFSVPSRKWIVDQLNVCNMAEIDFDHILAGIQIACSVDADEFKPCYDSAVSHYKKRYSEVVLGMHGPVESLGFEKARECLETIVSFCESSPDGCMSVG